MKKKCGVIILTLMCAFLMPAVSFADDESAPEFLVFGMPLSQRVENLSTHALEQYQIALSEFRIVDDCVEFPEGEPRYEFSLMRWKRLNTLEKVDVCVFLLAAELHDHRKLLNWFNSNGFKTILIEREPILMRFHQHDGNGFLVSASSSIMGPIRVGFLNRLLAHGVSIGVVITSDGEPLNVNTTVTTK